MAPTASNDDGGSGGLTGAALGAAIAVPVAVVLLAVVYGVYASSTSITSALYCVGLEMTKPPQAPAVFSI